MLRAVAPFYRLQSLFVSNVYFLDGGAGDRWLIDTGHVAERLSLLVELRRAGYRPDELTGVLLTHRHSDHAGNAAFLRRRFGVPVYAHRADARVLAGRAPRPRLSRSGGTRLAGLFARIENHFPATGFEVDRELEDGDALGGVEVHWMPGHTEGSVFYRHATSRSLLSGDALLTAHPPLTLRRGLATAYPSFTTDMSLADRSLRDFHARGYDYDNLLAGHGPPMIGRARERVVELLERPDDSR